MPPLSPATNAQFLVKFTIFDRVAELGFSKISGIGGTVDVIEIPQVSQRDKVEKFPDSVSYAPVRLDRGFDSNLTLFRWWQSIAQDRTAPLHNAIQVGPGPGYKTDVEIVFANTEIVGWTVILEDAWPSAYNMGSLNSSSTNILVNSVELTYDRIDILRNI